LIAVQVAGRERVYHVDLRPVDEQSIGVQQFGHKLIEINHQHLVVRFLHLVQLSPEFHAFLLLHARIPERWNVQQSALVGDQVFLIVVVRRLVLLGLLVSDVLQHLDIFVKLLVRIVGGAVEQPQKFPENVHAVDLQVFLYRQQQNNELLIRDLLEPELAQKVLVHKIGELLFFDHWIFRALLNPLAVQRGYVL
jgi:hypothetical protein